MAAVRQEYETMGDCIMEHYDFAILKHDDEIMAVQSITLPEPSAAWPRVAKFAQDVGEPGCLIRVTNEAGEVVVLVGIAAVRR
jgi:hypothetical protein